MTTDVYEIKTLCVFCGPKGVGKSTASRALVDRGFVEINFADSLKEICAVAFNIPLEVFYDPLHKNDVVPGTDLTVRTAMQKTGDFFRSHNQSIFAQNWLNRVKLCESKKIVVSDLRLVTEYDIIKQFKTKKIIRILPCECTQEEDITESVDLHETEQVWKMLPVDAELRNDRTVSDLRRRVYETVYG